MKTIFVRTAYNYDMNKAGDESALLCKDPSLAQQQFLEETNINTIVTKFLKTGELPQVSMPQPADFEGIFDFQTAMNIVRAGEEAFAQMDARVRQRFNNDPGKFLEFFHDPDNKAEAEKLGLVIPREAPGVIQARDKGDTPTPPEKAPKGAKTDP